MKIYGNIGIYNYYLKMAQKAIDLCKSPCPNILKTDAWNEWRALPSAGGIVKNLKTNGKFTLIEYDRDICSQIRVNYPDLNVINGDIRNLPFNNEEFDVLIDLSTIDHIPNNDVSGVINNYSQVLKKGGILLLIVWCSNVDNLVQGWRDKDWKPTNQYFFSEQEIKEEVSKYFEIIEEDKFNTDNCCYRYLVGYLGRKK